MKVSIFSAVVFETKHYGSLWVRFTDRLCHCKLSFGIKKLLSGFAKDMQWKGLDAAIFAADLIAYAL